MTGLTLYNGAVIAEIVRSGSAPAARTERGGRRTGHDHRGQTMRSILLPQAITSMLPVLISQLVVALKDTAIGYQIPSWRWSAKARQSTTYGNYVPALIVDRGATVITTNALSAAATRLERRRRSRRAPRRSPLLAAPWCRTATASSSSARGSARSLDAATSSLGCGDHRHDRRPSSLP